MNSSFLRFGSVVGVRVVVEEIALMHMGMRMHGPILMCMGVFVFAVVMVVRAVGVSMGQVAVTVRVGMGLDVRVFVGHIPGPFLYRVSDGTP